MDHEMADKVLFRFADIVDDLGLDWCLFAGACLGFFRDGGYIEGDNDIDVAVKAKPAQLKKMWARLQGRGFRLGRWCENVDGTKNRHVWGHPDKLWPEEGGIMIDVFYTFTPEEENVMVNYGQVWYKGRGFLVPYPVDRYLQDAYGEWWVKSDTQAAGKLGVEHVTKH
jgi:hypothetical protein